VPLSFRLHLLLLILLNLKPLNKIYSLVCTGFFNCVINFKHEDTLERYFSLHVRRKHLNAIFLINAFTGNNSCLSILGSVNLRIPSRSTTVHSTLFVVSLSLVPQQDVTSTSLTKTLFCLRILAFICIYSYIYLCFFSFLCIH
jgi:hypothetical protein